MGHNAPVFNKYIMLIIVVLEYDHLPKTDHARDGLALVQCIHEPSLLYHAVVYLSTWQL